MQIVKKTSEYQILKKRSGRYGVRSIATKKWINGDDKIKILASEGLIKPPAKKAEPEPAAEGEGEAAAAE